MVDISLDRCDTTIAKVVINYFKPWQIDTDIIIHQKKYTVLIKIVWNQVIMFPSYHNIKSFSIKGIKQMFVMNLCFQFLAVPRIQLKENVTKLISASVQSENGRGLHWQLFRHFIQTYKRSPIYAIVTVQYLIHYIYIYI